MKRQILNIKKEIDQFESVEFVNNMTQFQLKVMVKRLFSNFSDLANLLENKDAKIARIIDAILDGHSWKDIDVGERFSYIFYMGETFVYDRAQNTFAINHNNNTVSTFDSMTRSEIDLLHKKINSSRKKGL